MSKRSISVLAVVAAAGALVGLIVLGRSSSTAREKDKVAAQETAARNSLPALRPVPSDAASPSRPVQAPAPVLVPAGTDARPGTPEPARLTEAKLMEKLRQARAAGQHALAIQLAREGNQRFADSPLAPERESILIHSLADNEQRNEARGEAERMVNHYPDSEWVREVERFTGAHRRRNVRLNDAGEIEYY